MATAQPIAPMSSVSVNAAQAKAVKQTTANLNLRKSASVKSASLVLVPKNTKLTILKVSGNWHQVSYKSKTGWVSGDYLKSVPAEKAKVYNYTKSFTAVKAKASAGSAHVLSLHRQTKVEVLGRSGSWTQVLVSGKTGFVPASALSSSNPSAVYHWVKGAQPVFQSTKTSSKKIATLSNNTRITWLRTSGSWQQVRTSAGIGWIQSAKLSTTAIKAPAKAKVYNYTKSFTAVKAKAAVSSATVVSVHRQTKVEVLGKSGSWTKVLVAGRNGFVPTSSLSTSNPAGVYRWVNGRQPVF
ncbi:SH3 domain-containing protein, partial [Paeniglutamicibacter sp.]|uniref:SH3 domain-containing protein n=1 Tax=Paeniglutamicibacter sp. TaxID=1934391 RepID=UPI003989C47E